MIAYDIQALVKYYPGQERAANQNINLQIYSGEIFGLLGDNGSGKTTLVRQMVNLLGSTSGRITLWGVPVDHDPFFVPRYVGYMPQEAFAVTALTVGESLYYTAHLRGLSPEAARQERDRLIALWQIEYLYNQQSWSLSGGQRQLLHLAVAMAASPPVLILDEPTNELAPQRRRQVWEVLRQENRERQTTIILVTHDALEAEKVVQRVGIMYDAELVAVGRPSDLKKQIDQKLRLELFFAPSTPPVLPPDLHHHEIEPGRWIVYLDQPQASDVLAQLDASIIDDFRLYSATLEDLYIYYATARSQSA